MAAAAPVGCLARELSSSVTAAAVPTAKSTQIGIDLGTTNCCVSHWANGKAAVIPVDGRNTTPSYAQFLESGIVLGHAAKKNAASNPENTVFDAKRLIGRHFSDPEVQEDLASLPFKCRAGVNDEIIICVEHQDREYKPEEIAAKLLSKFKESAEAELGIAVNSAVITVPAYFNDAQRTATKEAGKLAGLEVLRVTNEPTAASIAYGLGLEEDDKKSGPRKVLIFDMGGGTFDVSLVQIEDAIFEVLATAGDTRLGGEDFDTALVEFCWKDFTEKNPNAAAFNDRQIKFAKARLRAPCEEAKRELSQGVSAEIDLTALVVTDDKKDSFDYNTTITRAKFEELCMDKFTDSMKPVERVLTDSDVAKSGLDVAKSEVHEVVLVGGSTRIPKVRQLLQDFFPGKPLAQTVNVDEAVAHGAAALAAQLGQTKKSGGNEKVDDKPLGEDFVLVDVTPLSLGLEIAGGKMQVQIPRNTSLPHEQTKMYTTFADNQPSVSVKVYEGEEVLIKDNKLLDEFKLEGLLIAPKGVPKIEVVFAIDTDGILTVTAKNEVDGVVKEAKTVVTARKTTIEQPPAKRSRVV